MAVITETFFYKSNSTDSYVELYNKSAQIMESCGFSKLSLPSDAGVFYKSGGTGDTILPNLTESAPFNPNTIEFLWKNSYLHPSGFIIELHCGYSSGGWSSTIPLVGFSVRKEGGANSPIYCSYKGNNPNSKNANLFLKACSGSDYFWFCMQPSESKKIATPSGGNSNFAITDNGIFIQKTGADSFFIAESISILSSNSVGMLNAPLALRSYIVKSGISESLGYAFGITASSKAATSYGARIIRIPNTLTGAQIKLGAIHYSFCSESGNDIAFDLLDTGLLQNYIATTTMGPVSPISIGTSPVDCFFIMLPVD